MELPLPKVTLYEDIAINVVTLIINKAKMRLNKHQSLQALAETRTAVGKPLILPLVRGEAPIIPHGEEYLKNAIEDSWQLSKRFTYNLKYVGLSKGDACVYYYFEAIFSQPTTQYPIPQASVAVYFTITDFLFERPSDKPFPMITFRLEGHYQDHDVRFVQLTADWILGVLQMKLRFFRRIEEINKF